MTTTTTPQPFDTLPNGATVITASESGDEGVVLARTIGPQPWVTWCYPAGHPEVTWGGHYFERLQAAVQDYYDRGGDDGE